MANKEPNLRANDERKELSDSKAGKGEEKETDRGIRLKLKKERRHIKSA